MTSWSQNSALSFIFHFHDNRAGAGILDINSGFHTSLFCNIYEPTVLVFTYFLNNKSLEKIINLFYFFLIKSVEPILIRCAVGPEAHTHTVSTQSHVGIDMPDGSAMELNEGGWGKRAQRLITTRPQTLNTPHKRNCRKV